MPEKRTEIGELGEFGLIDRLSSQLNIRRPSTLKGIGDDAAVLLPEGEAMLLSTDLLVEGVHFDLAYTPLAHLGYKAIAVNVSDMAAMNAKATQVTVGMALSNRFSVEALEALYQGMEAACKNYNIDLVGGDTTSSLSGLMISVTVVGYAQRDKVVYRKGAGLNDVICVTGDLGAPYLGLQVLEREKQVYQGDPDMQPQLEKYDYLIQRFLRPDARADIIFDLEEKGIVPTSMIDISDGLASELFHLGKNSGMGMRVFEDKIPVDAQTYDTALEFKLDPITCALNGGEDYELLFTIRQSDMDKLKDHADVHFIGYVQEAEKGFQLIGKQGHVYPLKAQGWDHFKQGEAKH